MVKIKRQRKRLKCHGTIFPHNPTMIVFWSCGYRGQLAVAPHILVMFLITQWNEEKLTTSKIQVSKIRFLSTVL